MNNKLTIKDFQKLINKAESRDELRKISYKAFLQDDKALNIRNGLYNKVVKACIQREIKLGIFG